MIVRTAPAATQPRALIVDDEPAIIQTVGDIVRSLDHQADTAGDVESAKTRLAARTYDYLILDMKIPVSTERKLGRRENGRNLIQILRANPQTVDLPIIVVTGEDSGESDFIISVMQVGGMAATRYIQKPIDGDKLDRAIQELLARRSGAAAAPPTLKPFRCDEPRLLELNPDRALLCGVQVWADCAYPEMGQVLRWLAERGPHGFVRLPGRELCKRLQRNGSNPIGQPIKRFRDTCTERLATCLHLDCGLYDVIGDTKGGGYHFTEQIEVRIVDESGTSTVSVTTAACPDADITAENLGLNPRQRWVLAEIEQGAELRQKALIEHFRREVNASTVKRDLKDLRDRGFIITGPKGHYLRMAGVPQ